MDHADGMHGGGGSGSYQHQATPNTPIQPPANFDVDEDDEDIIEQTFGVGDVGRNNQVFDNLPTPKSRMKRQIDLENETSVVAANANNAAQAGNNSNNQQQQRQKMFEDTSKRKSEHNVTEVKWVEDENQASQVKPIGRNQLYAASQKNIDTTDS